MARIYKSPLVSLLCLLFFFSASALAASAVLGVDLGTEFIKAALVKPGIPLEIVLTKDSRRKEAATIAFKPAKILKSGEFPERAYGSDAVALSARFPADVYPNLKKLLGLGSDNSIVQEYALRHPSLKLETDPSRGTAAFKSSAFTEEELPWTVEEILAMELQSIQKNAEALAGKGSRITDVVITVPTFYSAEEKRAVELAADLAGLRVLELISDGLAVGVNYATSRTFPSINEGGKPEHHLVFDMGAGSTKATVLKFQGRTVKDVGKFNKTIQEVRVVGSGWDRTLGGDALNAIIVDDMVKKFVEFAAKKGAVHTIEAVQSNGKTAAKLWLQAEKMRRVLSANTNTQASFEALFEDIDFKYKITRDEFEKMAEGHAARVGVVLQKALDSCDMEIENIDSVILHGGAIRTLFVQKQLEKFAGANKIKTNVNADEAAVFGAGFRGAALSPSFRVKEIRSYEGATYAAGIKWINIHEKPQHLRLWQPTANLGQEKQYSFQNQIDPFEVKFYQHVPGGENVSPGSAEKELLTLTTQNLNESVAHCKKLGCTDGDIRVKLSTRLAAKNGEIDIMRLVLECEVEPAEKESMVDSVKGLFGFGKKDQAPLAEDAESSVTSSTKIEIGTSSSTSSSSTASPSSKDETEKDPKKKKVEVIELKYIAEVKGLPQIPAAELTRMKERIIAFDDSDRSRRLREESLNQLEGFTYKTRDLLESPDFIAASTEAERSSLDSKARAASEWIYSEGAGASREELKAKLKEMRNIVDPIQVRVEEAVARPEQLKVLQDALAETKQTIAGITMQIETDAKAHAKFSSSKSAAKSTTTAAPTTVDDFAGLEDEEATSTTSAPMEEETMDPPTYTEADLIVPQSLYDVSSKWLEEKLAEQNKLSKTDDPVLLSKDLAARAKQLQDTNVQLIMKSMKSPQKPKQKPPVKPKKSKSKKAKKEKSSKTASAAKGEQTLDFDDLGANAAFKVGPDGELPSEEDILAFIKKSNEEREAAAKANGEDGDEKKHDEL